MNEYKPFVLFITCREMKGCGELEERQNQSPVRSRAEKKILKWKEGEPRRLPAPAASLHATVFSLQFGVSWERKSQDVSLFVQTEVLWPSHINIEEAVDFLTSVI